MAADVIYTYLGDLRKADRDADGTLMVYGVATGPKQDMDLQGCGSAWLRTAVPAWMQRGNIREMHRADSAVGKAQQAVETDDAEWMVAAKVVDSGAAKKVDEGVYTGFSIGVKNAVVQRSDKHPNGEIVGGDIIEVSLVDYPAYQYSKIATSPDEVGFPVLKSLGPGRWRYAGAVIEDVGLATRYEQPWMVRPGVTTPEQAQKMAQPDTAKRDFSQDERDSLADEGKALPDGSFPIETKKDLENAISAYGRAKDKAKAKAHIIARAKDLGATDMLPADWEGSTKEKTVAADIQKDQQIPVLEGDEAPHNEPLQAALTAIKELISQELAEDEGEFDCVQTLSHIGQCLVMWAQGEATEGMGGYGMEPWMAYAASVKAVRDIKEPAARRTLVKALAKEMKMPDETKAAEDNTHSHEHTHEDGTTHTHEHMHAGGLHAKSDDGAPHAHEHDGEADEETEKAATGDAEKAGRTISRATAETLTSLANTPGTPATVRQALLNMANASESDAFDRGGDKEGPDDAPGPAGDTPVIRPEPIDLMSPVRPQAEGNESPAFDRDGSKAATLSEYIDERATEIAADVLAKFISSETFLAKLASGDQAKAATAEAAETAKAATADLTTKVGEVDAKVGELDELQKALQADIERIKRLPQAPKAVAQVLPKGVTPVDRTFAANRGEDAQPVDPNPEISELIAKASRGDGVAQQRLRELFSQANATAVAPEILKGTYEAQRR